MDSKTVLLWYVDAEKWWQEDIQVFIFLYLNHNVSVRAENF